MSHTTDTIKALRDALAEARSALKHCYDVESYPGDGSSAQDSAIKMADAALALTADASDQAHSRDENELYGAAMKAARKWANLQYMHAKNLGAGGPGKEDEASAAEDSFRVALDAMFDAARPAPIGAAPAPAVRTMQRIFFPDGRASVSALQRTSRLSWDSSREFLQALNDAGWLTGLDVSPHIEQAAAPAAPIADIGNAVSVPRATLEMIYEAMNHMGDQLNEMDVVEPDDEKVFPAFDAIRELLSHPAADHAKPEPVEQDVTLPDVFTTAEALFEAMGVNEPVAHAKLAEGAGEREQFEAYWCKVDLSPSLPYQNRFELNCEGNYLYVETRLAWETWQARGQQAGAVDGGDHADHPDA